MGPQRYPVKCHCYVSPTVHEDWWSRSQLPFVAFGMCYVSSQPVSESRVKLCPCCPCRPCYPAASILNAGYMSVFVIVFSFKTVIPGFEETWSKSKTKNSEGNTSELSNQFNLIYGILWPRKYQSDELTVEIMAAITNTAALLQTDNFSLVIFGTTTTTPKWPSSGALPRPKKRIKVCFCICQNVPLNINKKHI